MAKILTQLALVLVTAGSAAHSAPAVDPRPNVIVLLADDMGYSDIGCFGSEISTPNIDALAKRGVRFTQFYNGAVCCPTRAALLTGLYSHQAGVGWMVTHGSDTGPAGPYQGYLNQSCVTLAEVMKAGGYQTYMSGKWHVGENRPHWPVDRGFDHYFGLISGAANYFDIRKSERPGIVRQMAIDDRPYLPPPEGFYMTDAIGEHAVRYLRDAAANPAPFLLYVAFTAPHAPLHAFPEDIAKYRGRYKAGFERVRRERFRRMQQLGVLPADAVLPPMDPRESGIKDRDEDLMDLKMAIYAAQVERMDRAVGAVLRALKETGREENTIVLFLSDNGAAAADSTAPRSAQFKRAPFLGGPESYDAYGRAWANVSNTPWRDYKTWLYEGGISTPLIVAWPAGLKAHGEIRPEVNHLIDVMPTLLELCQVPYPATFQGRKILPLEGESFAALVRGGQHRRRAPLFWEFQGNRAVRDGDWKLVANEGAPWELFNVGTDRCETHELSAQEPARVAAMTALYEQWAARCGVRPWPEIAPHVHNLPP